MEFQPIFMVENPSLWAVCYPEGKGLDAFELLMDHLNDTEYLFNFFINNQYLLSSSYWENISVDNAIDQILDEARDIEEELKLMEEKVSKGENVSFSSIFEPLHEGVYILKRKNNRLRKARTNPNLYNKPMLRIYAVELDDSSYVITGGAIKLSKLMIGTEMEIELKNLDRVRKFIEEQKIVSREGLY